MSATSVHRTYKESEGAFFRRKCNLSGTAGKLRLYTRLKDYKKFFEAIFLFEKAEKKKEKIENFRKGRKEKWKRKSQVWT